MNTGWVKLHRQLLDWEWYGDINVTRLFLHLMLKANHKDKKYRGTVIKRGQLLTGRGLLSKETGLTEQQIRTCLAKLKSTSDITIKSTSKGTLLTVDNYSIYQGCDDSSTSKSTSTLTNEQPASNQRVTTNKNVKNENNDKALYQQIADSWNSIFKDELPAVSKITQKRKSAINGCIAEMKGTKHDFSKIELWHKLFNHAKLSNFLMGGSKDGWTMNFDFIITKSKLLKIVEGQYDN